MFYLDDLLIMANRKEKVAEHCAATTYLLEFLVNYTKSRIQLVKSFTSLGFVVESCKKELSPPITKNSRKRFLPCKRVGKHTARAVSLECVDSEKTFT